MIVGYVGNMGSGKTLSMVKEAFNLFNKGYTIYSNIKLNFPHKVLDMEEILSYANEDKSFHKAVFLIDEAHIFIDSRRSASKRSLLMTYFITQTRKKDVTLLYTTQNIGQVEKRLRQQTDIICECFSKVYNAIHIILNKFSVFRMEGIAVHHKVFLGIKYYDLYNTYEVVKSI